MCGTELEARQAIEKVIDAAGSYAKGWWVLNTLQLREGKNSDVDILVGIPGAGLLILEHKGWTGFEVDDTGHWTEVLRDGRTRPKGAGPFAQASRQEYLLLELLKRSRQSKALDSGNLPLIGSGVVFGNLTSREMDDPGWTHDDRFVLFRDTLCPSPQPSHKEATQILGRLKAILSASPTPDRKVDNGAPRLEQVFELLNPMRQATGLHAFVTESHDTLDQLVETAMTAKAEDLNSSRVYVEGAAGTGKTVFGLALGRHQSLANNRPALFLCSSPLLAAEQRELTRDDEGSVEIFTPEELLEAVAGQEALTRFKEKEEAEAQAARDAAELMRIDPAASMPQRRAYLGNEEFWEELTVAVSDRSYAAIVVDEAQDLWEPAFSYLSALAGDSTFAICVDPNQTTRRERAGVPWEIPESMLNAHRVELKRNFRNGDRIIDEVEDRFSIGYQRPPTVVRAEVSQLPYAKANPFEQTIKEEFDRLVAAGLEPVVLTTGTSVEQDSALSSLGIKAHTVDSFKGLERKAVILALGNHRNPLDPNDEDLYVGMTRATVLLSIVVHSSMTVPTHNGQ